MIKPIYLNVCLETKKSGKIAPRWNTGLSRKTILRISPKKLRDFLVKDTNCTAVLCWPPTTPMMADHNPNDIVQSMRKLLPERKRRSVGYRWAAREQSSPENDSCHELQIPNLS